MAAPRPAPLPVIEPADRELALLAFYEDQRRDFDSAIEQLSRQRNLQLLEATIAKVDDLRILELAATGSEINSRALREPIAAQAALLLNAPLGQLSEKIEHAERLKTLHGSAFATLPDEREIITYPCVSGMTQGSLNQITKAQLACIIRPRVEEILDLMRRRLAASGFAAEVAQHLVLTGGGSQLTGLPELASNMFGRPARLGRPRVMTGLPPAAAAPGRTELHSVRWPVAGPFRSRVFGPRGAVWNPRLGGPWRVPSCGRRYVRFQLHRDADGSARPEVRRCRGAWAAPRGWPPGSRSADIASAGRRWFRGP